MKIVPVPKHAAPVGATLTWLPAPAGCDFTKPLPVAKVSTERGVNQYTVAIELEPGDLAALALEGRFTITFFGSAPLFILDTIEPSSSDSDVARAADDCGLPAGALSSTARGTAEQMEGPYSARCPSSSVGETSRRAPASAVPLPRSG